MNPDQKIKTCKKMMGDFMPFAQKTIGFEQAPQIKFLSNPTNASNALGKTAYYDPNKRCVALYIDDRHPKDIMRSLSHELVHHTQNLRGDLQNIGSLGQEGYAQEDGHMREMEREAYEQGNLCFRDWEDGYKKEQGNIIMEDRITEQQVGPEELEAPEDWEEENLTNQESDYWYEEDDRYIDDIEDIDAMVDIGHDMSMDREDKGWTDWWKDTADQRPPSDSGPAPGPVPGGSVSSRHTPDEASEKGMRLGRWKDGVSKRPKDTRVRDKEEISAQSQLQEAITKTLLNNPKLLKEALSKKQKFVQAIRGQLENKMKKKNINEEFVREVVRRYLTEMGSVKDPLQRPDSMDNVLDGVKVGGRQGFSDFTGHEETCEACMAGNCPMHDEAPSPCGDSKPLVNTGDEYNPRHDGIAAWEEGDLYEDEGLREGDIPDGLKAYMDKKKGKKGEKGEEVEDDKKETNESKIYIPENRSMYELHDQRLFENLSKWAIKK